MISYPKAIFYYCFGLPKTLWRKNEPNACLLPFGRNSMWIMQVKESHLTVMQQVRIKCFCRRPRLDFGLQCRIRLLCTTHCTRLRCLKVRYSSEDFCTCFEIYSQRNNGDKQIFCTCMHNGPKFVQIGLISFGWTVEFPSMRAFCW